MKIGETVKIRLQGGKVKKGVITDFVPDLYTHTHTHTCGRPHRRG